MIAGLRALPRAETLALLASVVVLALLGQWTHQANAPTPLASYSSYDADTGGTRALYELLQHEGMRVDRFQNRALFLDASIATLVWIEPLDFDPNQRTPSKAEVSALETWVKKGGTFLYVGHDRAAARERILKLPYPEDVKTKSRHPFVDPLLARAGVRSISDGPGLRWRHDGVTGRRVLLGDAYGDLVVRYAYGRGTITAVVDEDLVSNSGIAVGDRPRLAYALAALKPNGTIAFEEAVHGYFVPEHWWQIAPRPLVIAVSIALAALALAGIGAAVRLGPPLVPVVRDDASTSDFIGALAGLLSSGGARRDAMLTAANSTTRALARSFGLGDGATTSDVAARIDREDRRRDYATMLAVTANGFPDDRNLVRGVALAQDLRKDYAAHVDRRR